MNVSDKTNINLYAFQTIKFQLHTNKKSKGMLVTKQILILGKMRIYLFMTVYMKVRRG